MAVFRKAQKCPKNRVRGWLFGTFCGRLSKFSRVIPKHQLDELRAIIAREHARRFKSRREPRYGTINKSFTELELQHFLRNVPNEKFRLLFKYQAYLGLRVGEACKLHISNIDFDKRELTIKSEKSSKLDSLIILLDLFKETIEFLNKNSIAVKAANGFIFFKDNDNNHNGVPHVDVDYVRKVFREVLKTAGLDQIYAYSEETDSTHRSRPLHRLTTHSLRHYAITHFAKSTNGNVVLTSRFARHADPATTMHYIAKDNTQLYEEIDAAFNSSELDTIKLLAQPTKKGYINV